jgi:hypothetical protein
MNYLGCELVHFNPNAIIALSYFTMLCECWLGITSDTSLFWYYYSPAWYDKVVYGGIGLSLRHHRRKEYIKAIFKSCWKDSQKRWFLVDMHVEPKWVNKLMFPLKVKDKRGESKVTPRLATLIKRVAELHQDELNVCHCAKEFTLRQICPLAHQEKPAYACPQLADPSREPTSGKIFHSQVLIPTVVLS